MNFFEKMSKETSVPICNIEFLSDIEAPYGVYQVTDENPIYADGRIVYNEKSVDFVLYHRKHDLYSEKIIDKYFEQNKIAYEKTNTWIEEDKLIETLYELNFNKMEEL